MPQVILLHRSAPTKPEPGQPCNGCGVCCASEPCPLGMLVSGRRRGRCDALQWNEAGGQYRCGLIAAPAAHLPTPLKWTAPLLAQLAQRAISAGSGCDCELGVEPGEEAGVCGQEVSRFD